MAATVHKVAVLAVLGMTALGASSTGSLSVELVSVQPIPLARIRVVIHNPSDAPIFVPYCGERGGAYALCGLAAHLEVKTKSGWQKARDAEGAGLSGGLALGDSRKITVGSHRAWEYEFMTAAFQIEPRDQLRLVIDAWHDQAAVATEKPPIHISTEVFLLPASATP